MGFIHDACSNDAIGLSGLESVMNAQRDGQKERLKRERERESNYSYTKVVLHLRGFQNCLQMTQQKAN